MSIPEQSRSDEELRRILADLELLERRQTYYRWAYFTPYAKQREFLDLGASKRERLLMAANRCGKTETGAFEAACHATGIYPPLVARQALSQQADKRLGLWSDQPCDPRRGADQTGRRAGRA